MEISRPPRLPAPLAIVSVAVVLAGASAARAEDKAAILLPGSANDQSWNALGYSILKSLEPHGFKTAYSENVADADEAEAMRDYANQGYQIVMGHSGRFVSAMEQVAPDFPKTQFIAVSGNEGKPPNVMSIDWNNAQFGCQLGLLAAQMSKTHKVGGVYGLQGVPNITAQAGGFRICATKGRRESDDPLHQGHGRRRGGERSGSVADRQGADVITGKLNAAEAGLVAGGQGEECLCDGPRLRPDKNRAGTRADQHHRGLAGHVRQHLRPGEGRQAVRNFVQYGYDTAPVTGATLQYDRGKPSTRSCPPPSSSSSTTWRRSSRRGALKITPTRERRAGRAGTPDGVGARRWSGSRRVADREP